MPAIRLVTGDLAVLDAALEDAKALARVLGCDVADGWNGHPDALRRTRDLVAADPSSAAWGTRLFVLSHPRTLVGWGGFKGAPRNATVELGYEIAPAWRGRGLAGAAVREMLDEAWADPGVRSVVAHTLPAPGPSVRVLERAGFVLEGPVADEQVGTAWRHRRVRPGAG